MLIGLHLCHKIRDVNSKWWLKSKMAALTSVSNFGLERATDMSDTSKNMFSTVRNGSLKSDFALN